MNDKEIKNEKTHIDRSVTSETISTKNSSYVLSFFNKLINNIDYFGMEPKLYYKDKSKLTSILGGIISLLIIVVMVIFTYISGKEIFDHNNPTVLLSSNYDVNPRQYNLTEKNFGLFVGMQDSSANYYIDDRVYDLVVLSRRRFTSKNQDNSLKIVSQTKKLDIEKCDLK